MLWNTVKIRKKVWKWLRFEKHCLGSLTFPKQEPSLAFPQPISPTAHFLLRDTPIHLSTTCKLSVTGIPKNQLDKPVKRFIPFNNQLSPTLVLRDIPLQSPVGGWAKLWPMFYPLETEPISILTINYHNASGGKLFNSMPFFFSPHRPTQAGALSIFPIRPFIEKTPFSG